MKEESGKKRTEVRGQTPERSEGRRQKAEVRKSEATACTARSSILLRQRAGGADFVSQSPRFCFERANGELGAALAVAQIFADEWLEAAAAFALRHVCELVQEQFAVTPGTGADNDR